MSIDREAGSRRRAWGTALAALGLLADAAGCDQNGSVVQAASSSDSGGGGVVISSPPGTGGTCSGGCANNAVCTFNTYLGASTYVEIDQDTSDGGSASGNANLTVESGTTNNFPAASNPMTAAFIDWNSTELSGSATINNHLLRDLDSGNKDPTAFPMGSNSACLGSAGVEGKFDLTYVAAASNNEYVYLAVARADNNGDGAYYWLFTRVQPTLPRNSAPGSTGVGPEKLRPPV
jgi:hypothetical protein